LAPYLLLTRAGHFLPLKPLPLAVERDGSSRLKCAFWFHAASGRIKQAATYGGGT